MTSSAAVFIPLFTLYDSALICSLQTLRSFYIWSCEQPQVCFTAAMELVLWLCFYLLAVLIRYLDSNVSRTLGLCLTLSKYWYSFYNRGCDVVPLELLATSRLLNCCSNISEQLETAAQHKHVERWRRCYSILLYFNSTDGRQWVLLVLVESRCVCARTMASIRFNKTSHFVTFCRIKSVCLLFPVL